MAKWLAKEFDWDTGRYTGRYYDIAEAGIVAVFVDSFYGDNTAAGTAAAPFKTLGKAITTLNSTGANGSRIFMNGIFSETLPTQTYWYQFIGCGGGRFGKTIWMYSSGTGVFPVLRVNSYYENLSTLNFEKTITLIPNFKVGVLNCYFYRVRIGQIAVSGTNINLTSYFSIFNNCRIFISEVSNRIGYIYGDKNIFYNCDAFWSVSSGGPLRLYANNSFVNDTSFIDSDGDKAINWVNYGVGNIYNQIGQFNNITNVDFNVRITSPLLGAGTVDEITGIATNVGGVEVGLPYNGISPEFTTEGGATITDLTIDANGKFTITAPATTGTLETALMDLGNIYPIERIDLFNVFDFLDGEITQGVFEDFSSPRMALTIKLKYGLTSAEVDDCPWLLIEYGKQPTFSGTGASRVGNADDTFDPDTFQTITCRYMKLFITLQNNS